MVTLPTGDFFVIFISSYICIYSLQVHIFVPHMINIVLLKKNDKKKEIKMNVLNPFENPSFHPSTIMGKQEDSK